MPAYTGDTFGDYGDADCLGNWEPQKAVFLEKYSLEEGYDLACFVLVLETPAPQRSGQGGYVIILIQTCNSKYLNELENVGTCNTLSHLEQAPLGRLLELLDKNFCKDMGFMYPCRVC